mgnify:CR=1 FL=1
MCDNKQCLSIVLRINNIEPNKPFNITANCKSVGVPLKTPGLISWIIGSSKVDNVSVEWVSMRTSFKRQFTTTFAASGS